MIAQPFMTSTRLTTVAAKAAANAATAAVGNITAVGNMPNGITGFTSTPKSASITFTTAKPVSKIDALVDHAKIPQTLKNIPLFMSPKLGTGTAIYANVSPSGSGSTVTIKNASNGSCCFNILGGDSGTFTLNVYT